MMTTLDPKAEFTFASQVSRIRSQSREPFDKTLNSLSVKDRKAVRNQIESLNRGAKELLEGADSGTDKVEN